MTIDEVGCAVGMDGAGYFSRMFKKSEGISPKNTASSGSNGKNQYSAKIMQDKLCFFF